MSAPNPDDGPRPVDDLLDGVHRAATDPTVAAPSLDVSRTPFESLARLVGGPDDDVTRQLGDLYRALDPATRTVDRRLVGDAAGAAVGRITGVFARPLWGLPPNRNRIDVELVEVVAPTAGPQGWYWGLADELRIAAQLDAVTLPDALGKPGPSAWRLPAGGPDTTGADAAVAVVRELVEGIVSTGETGRVPAVLADSLTFSRPGLGLAFPLVALAAGRSLADAPTFPGVSGFLAGLGGLRTAFPDYRQVVGPVPVVDGGLVVAPIHTWGTHRGELFGLPATGRTISFAECLVVTVRDGRVRDLWAMGDELAYCRDLGLLPESSAVGGGAA